MFLLFGINQLPLINTIQNASLHILSKEPKELTRFRIPRVRGSTIMLRFIIILAVFILFLTFYLWYITSILINKSAKVQNFFDDHY